MQFLIQPWIMFFFHFQWGVQLVFVWPWKQKATDIQISRGVFSWLWSHRSEWILPISLIKKCKICKISCDLKLFQSIKLNSSPHIFCIHTFTTLHPIPIYHMHYLYWCIWCVYLWALSYIPHPFLWCMWGIGLIMFLYLSLPLAHTSILITSVHL